MRLWTTRGSYRNCEISAQDLSHPSLRQLLKGQPLCKNLQAVPKHASTIGRERPSRRTAGPDFTGSAAIGGDWTRPVTPEAAGSSPVDAARLRSRLSARASSRPALWAGLLASVPLFERSLVSPSSAVLSTAARSAKVLLLSAESSDRIQTCGAARRNEHRRDREHQEEHRDRYGNQRIRFAHSE